MFEDTKVVVFDCDGVMFDSKEANERYYNQIRRSVGLPDMDEEELEVVHMQTSLQSVKYLFRNHPELMGMAFACYKQLNYSQFLQYMVMEPDLKEVLAYLRKNYKTALVTNRTTTLSDLLQSHGLDTFFDMVVSALDVRNPKPHPEPLNKVVDHFGIQPLQAVYIGDSPLDEEAALQASMPLIAFRNPKLQAALHIQHLKQLKTVL